MPKLNSLLIQVPSTIRMEQKYNLAINWFAAFPQIVMGWIISQQRVPEFTRLRRQLAAFGFNVVEVCFQKRAVDRGKVARHLLQIFEIDRIFAFGLLLFRPRRIPGFDSHCKFEQFSSRFTTPVFLVQKPDQVETLSHRRYPFDGLLNLRQESSKSFSNPDLKRCSILIFEFPDDRFEILDLDSKSAQIIFPLCSDCFRIN